MIALTDYLGRWSSHPDATPERRANAGLLLECCAKLQAMAEADGVVFPENPMTESQISGSTYGGFRPQECPIGAPRSNHKEGRAVDLYDPKGEIDTWCLNNKPKLAECGIYIEAPSKTTGWSHWQNVAPKSGTRVFFP